MNSNCPRPHSHSGLERELDIPKCSIIVDVQYKEMFEELGIKTTIIKAPDMESRAIDLKPEEYILVPTSAFVKLHGIFKNFDW